MARLLSTDEAGLARWRSLCLPSFARIAGFAGIFAPDAEQEWVWITPGTLVATVLWLLGSLAFNFHVANFTNYNAA
jgi:membrane protein